MWFKRYDKRMCIFMPPQGMMAALGHASRVSSTQVDNEI